MKVEELLKLIDAGFTADMIVTMTNQKQTEPAQKQTEQTQKQTEQTQKQTEPDQKESMTEQMMNDLMKSIDSLTATVQASNLEQLEKKDERSVHDIIMDMMD